MTGTRTRASRPGPSVRRGALGVLDPGRPWIRLARFALGAVVALAVAKSIWDTASRQGVDAIVDELSLFTVLAGTLWAAIAIVGALAAPSSMPSWWDGLRGAATLYACMTGIVYAVFIADPAAFGSWDLPWPNLVLHRLLPLAALLDWLLVPMRGRPNAWRPLVWLVFPLLYVAYTWLRGSAVGWYPYDFLDPTLPGGWSSVLRTSGIVLGAFLLGAVVVHLVGAGRAAMSRRG